MANVTVPAQFTTVTGIGDPISVYKPDTRKTIILELSIIAVGIAALGLTSWTPGTFREFYPLLVVGLVIVILAVVFAAGRRTAARWNDAAVVYHGGFAYFNGKSILLFEWNDIVDIAVDMAGLSRGKEIVATVRNFVVTHRNGKQLIVNKAIRAYGELCDQIRAQAFPHIMASSRHIFFLGKLVWFGEVAMGKNQGILVGHDNLRWRDIGQILLERRRVVVKPKQGRKLRALTAPVQDVHNLDVFLALGEEMLKEYG